MSLPNWSDIEEASDLLKTHIVNTPVLVYEGSFTTAKEVFFKCENFQRSGSFKARGAFNACLKISTNDRLKGVVTFSSGNHALAISMAAKLLSIPAVIVMPKDAPTLKIDGTRANGAEIVFYDRIAGEDREAICKSISALRGMTIIPPFNHQHVICGQGTAAMELFQSVGELDYLFVCAGGFGLLSGCALAAATLSPLCKVIGVEPLEGNDGQRSLQCGEIITIPVPKTIADGAQTQAIGKLPFELIKQLGNVTVVTATDDELLECLRFFAKQMKMIVEPTGCLSLAGLKFGGIDVTGKKCGVIVSGGNVDLQKYASYVGVS